MGTRVHRCPNCDASLDLDRLGSGARVVTCSFCGSDVEVDRPKTQVAPTPARAAPVRPVATATPAVPAAPTVGGALFDAFAKHAAMILAPGIGWILVVTAALFWRPPGEPVTWAVLAAICAITLAGVRCRGPAVLLALAVGVLLASKPFLRPIMLDGWALPPTSETGLSYLVPGVILVVLAVIVAATIRLTGLREEIAKLRPRVRVVLPLATGIGLAAWWYGGETDVDVVARHRRALDDLRARVLAVADAIDTDAAPSSSPTTLTPLPEWLDDSLAGNTEMLAYEMLRNPEASPSAGLYLEGDLRTALRRGSAGAQPDRAHWERSAWLGSAIRKAESAIWLAVYRVDGSIADVWLADMRSGEVVLQARALSESNSWSALRQAVLETLTRTTGGSFSLGND